MDKLGNVGFFQSWIDDYKKIKELNEGRDFTFIPDGAVTNPREFTNVLFEFANKEKKDLVITKESLYPEFTMVGNSLLFFVSANVNISKNATGHTSSVAFLFAIYIVYF